MDAKFYAATQVMDEARHVEAFSRLLHEKYALVYPINPHLKSLLEDTLRDSRWDMTYLGMQVLIEGVALAAFGLIRDYARNPLSKSVTAYVMQDEARHVAFGRLALRDYYPQLTDRGARRARGVRGRGLLPAARPLPRRRGLGGAGPAAGRVPRVGRPLRADARLPHQPVRTHRPDHQGHRPVGAAHPQGLRRHGHPRFRGRRHRGHGPARRGRGTRARGATRRGPPHGAAAAASG